MQPFLHYDLASVRWSLYHQRERDREDTNQAIRLLARAHTVAGGPVFFLRPFFVFLPLALAHTFPCAALLSPFWPGNREQPEYVRAVARD